VLRSVSCMNQVAKHQLVTGRPTQRNSEALRKCGVDLPTLRTAVDGPRRRRWWQRTRCVGYFDVVRFASMLADERAGRG
jgi:hypothetical protein